MTSQTAAVIADRMRAALGAESPGERPGSDGFRAGTADVPVQRILVCQSPSVAVIKRTRPGERTLIVSREDPFYFTLDTAGSTPNIDWSNGLAAQESTNPIVLAKRALIEGRDAVCYRLSIGWDKARPGYQSRALAAALGLTPVSGPEPSAAYATIAPTTFGRLAGDVASRLDLHSMRAHGAADTHVRRVAILNGLVPIPRLARTLADPSVDAVILGETCEWELTPYFADLLTGGRRMGMLLVGYQTSDRFGIAGMAELARSVAGDLPVQLYSDGEPGWIA